MIYMTPGKNTNKLEDISWVDDITPVNLSTHSSMDPYKNNVDPMWWVVFDTDMHQWSAMELHCVYLSSLNTPTELGPNYVPKFFSGLWVDGSRRVYDIDSGFNYCFHCGHNSYAAKELSMLLNAIPDKNCADIMGQLVKANKQYESIKQLICTLNRANTIFTKLFTNPR